MRGLSTVEWIVNHPLSKGRRAQNIARFLAWQMHSRFIRRPHIFETANGAKMWAISGMTGATGNLYVGLHEFEEMAFLLHFLRAADLLWMLAQMSARILFLLRRPWGLKRYHLNPEKRPSVGSRAT